MTSFCLFNAHEDLIPQGLEELSMRQSYFYNHVVTSNIFKFGAKILPVTRIMSSVCRLVYKNMQILQAWQKENQIHLWSKQLSW